MVNTFLLLNFAERFAVAARRRIGEIAAQLEPCRQLLQVCRIGQTQIQGGMIAGSVISGV